MIVAGIDPGLQNTGLAIVKKMDQSVELVQYHLVKNKQSDSFDARLKTIYDQIFDFFRSFRPDVVALEEVFYAKNAQVALKMGHARGVAILAAANSGIPVVEYSPREIKLSVTGNGNASKYQVQQMILKILGITEIPETFDITDAMAAAYCHSQRAKT
ncbi:crossover junction endodeoxyribonuclease RuvC [candidate division KSB1 bacterium 4484_87]|nr:MAG: crossover junction endodeoxyribonuclease RuvC [candidate division KSB1 bacterium 4484_87]